MPPQAAQEVLWYPASLGSVSKHSMVSTIILLIWFVGKSFFGIYVLLRRLAEDKDVMYALGAQDDVVRFQSGTAYIIAEPREECKDHTGSPNDANRPWMLIEPGTSQSDHKLNIFLLHHSLYRVAFFAPGTSSTKSLLGHYLFHKWDMSLWTEDELVQLYVRRALLRVRRANTR